MFRVTRRKPDSSNFSPEIFKRNSKRYIQRNNFPLQKQQRLHRFIKIKSSAECSNFHGSTNRSIDHRFDFPGAKHARCTGIGELVCDRRIWSALFLNLSEDREARLELRSSRRIYLSSTIK